MKRPMGIQKKGPVYRDAATRWLMQLSKACLADCVIDLMRQTGESVDERVTEERAAQRLRPVLAMRYDSEPPTRPGELVDPGSGDEAGSDFVDDVMASGPQPAKDLLRKLGLAR